jgi:hypothetical protein
LFKYTALGAQRQTHDQLLHFLLLCDYMVLHAIKVCVLESTRRVCARFAFPRSTRARAAHPQRTSALAAESDADGGEGGRDKGGTTEISVEQKRVCSPIVRVDLTLDLRRRELDSQDASIDSEDPRPAAGGESDGEAEEVEVEVEAEEVEAVAEAAGEEEEGGGSVRGREGTTHRRKTSGKSSGKSSDKSSGKLSGKLSASQASACLLLTPAEHELAAEINGIVSSFLATAGCRFYRFTTSFTTSLTTCGVYILYV